MRKVRLGAKNGPGVTVDHWRLDKDISIEIDGVMPPVIYLKPRQVDALITALQKAKAEISKIR
jgi:hypothetical protein